MNLSRLLAPFLIVSLLAVFAPAARADLIAYEPFEYATTQTESGVSGGSGWTAPWTYSVRLYPQASTFTDLYPDSVVKRSGNMALKLSSQVTTISRPFQLPRPIPFQDGSSVWFSFFLQLNNAPTHFVHFGFASDTNANSGIGISISPGGGGSFRARISGTVSSGARAIGLNDAWDADKRFLVLGRFTRVPDAPDQLEIWLNPASEALSTGVLPAADLVVNEELVGLPGVFRASNSAGANGGNIAYRIDEIRLATTLEAALRGTRAPGDLTYDPPPPPADGVHYYVSAATGDDANPGTSELPFRTLGRIAPHLQPGQTCVVRAGVYRELLRPARSGVAGQPITFLAAPGERVVVTGLDAVSGWIPAGGGLWRALWPSPLSALQTQVFFDGAVGHQARWPNRTDDNLLDPQGAAFSSGSDATKIVAASLPAGLPADHFEGGTVWALAGKRWSSWRSPVTAFDPATKTITFETFAGTNLESWVHDNHRPAPGPGAEFYVSGARKLLDAEREWHYDPAFAELVVMPPAGFDPVVNVIEMQTRLEAIDLSSRSHVVVKGFEVVGSAVSLVGAQHCVVEGVAISHPTAVRNARGTNYAAGRAGIKISGSANTVRESSVVWSWESGIEITGDGHRVINNLVSDVNLFGTYAAGLSLDANSADVVVAWNTVRRTGRDGIIANGRGHRFVHNRISQLGSICDDTGGIYTAGQGADYLFAYNWVHDAGSGMKAGIYLDNFTTGVAVHHNVVWNIAWASLVLNRPSAYHVVAHNTLSGKITNYFGPWTGVRNTSSGTIVANNLIGGPLEVNYGAILATNFADSADLGFEVTGATITPAPSRPGLAAGSHLPGLSQTAATVAPDVGAFQTGVDYPTPGHDFSVRRDTWFDAPPSPLVQRIDNNLFMRGLSGWTPGPTGTAAIYNSSGFNFPGPESRNSIHAQSVALSGGAHVEQTVADLQPGAIYTFWAFRKISEATVAGLSVIFPDGREYRHTFGTSSLNWMLVENFEFTVPADQSEARVRLWMEGPGTAYFDHVGLMQKWPVAPLHYNPTRFTQHPADRSAIAGASAVFTATSAVMSTRVNRWEWRAPGSTAWMPLANAPGVTVNSGRDNPSVTLNPLRPELHGAAFRCVSTHLGFHAYSRPAVLTVSGVSLDRASGRVGVDGHDYAVAVDLPAGVAWTVEGLPAWITASPASGTGPGTVSLVVADNPAAAPREATIRIAGRDHLVRQSDGELFLEWVQTVAADRRGAADSAAGDGMPNLLKYALGLDNPLTPPAARAPRLVGAGPEGAVEFVFPRAARRTDLRYVVRAADDLAAPSRDWPAVAHAAPGAPFESLAPAVEVAEAPAAEGAIEVRVTDATPSSSARFYVLEVLLDDATE